MSRAASFQLLGQRFEACSKPVVPEFAMPPGCPTEDTEEKNPSLSRFCCGELLAHERFAITEPFFVRENSLVSSAVRFERSAI
jgi:hypothetical protein